jgi:histone H3/H4
MQAQKTEVAAARAAGASGGPGNRTPAREWYTIVVYEKPRSKTVVLYLGAKAVTFKIPADVEIRDLAVVIKRWLAGGKVPAYSARIHVKNLAELLNAYAPDVAEQLAPTLRVAEVVAYADGAQPEDACGEVRGLIRDMRSDGYLAVRVDEVVKAVNEALRAAAEEGGRKAAEVTAEAVRRCLKHDDTIEIITEDGGEVLWLWGGWYIHALIDRVVKLAAKYGEVGVWFDAGGP